MKITFLPLLVLLLLAPGLVQGGAPALVADQADFNFGQAFQGEKVEHVFRFRNAGDATLSLEKVQSSCGCTAAVVSTSTIPPGESGEVRAVFDTKRFQGKVDKTIYIYSNDPRRNPMQFHLRGVIRLPVEMEPALVDWPDMRPGVSQKTEVTLTNRTKERIVLQEIKSTLAEVRAKLPGNPQLDPGKSVRLQVEIQPREGKERLAGYLLVRTDSNLVPELSVPVRARLGKKP